MPWTDYDKIGDGNYDRRFPGSREFVWHSNGFIGPGSKVDYSEPGNYRPGPTAEEIEEAKRFWQMVKSKGEKGDTER